MAVAEADSHAAMALPTPRCASGPSPEVSLLQFGRDNDSRVAEDGSSNTLDSA